MAPPEAPPVLAYDEGDNLRRLRMRLWQVMMTALTVLITAWLCTLGAFTAILALMVAKHVLVAILVVGLEPPASE
jgi:hypothetical protein